MSPKTLILVLCARSKVFLVVKQRASSLRNERNKCQTGKVSGPHVKSQKAVSKWWIGQGPGQRRRGAGASSALSSREVSPQPKAGGARAHRLCPHMLCPHGARTPAEGTPAEGTPHPQAAEPDSGVTSRVMLWQQPAEVPRADLIPISFPVPRCQRSPCAPGASPAAGLRARGSPCWPPNLLPAGLSSVADLVLKPNKCSKPEGFGIWPDKKNK